MVFITKPGVLWKVDCPFKLERGKLLGTQTGIFLTCPDFFWDLAMKSPTKACMPPKNLRKIQDKKGSWLLLKERRVVLPQSTYSTSKLSSSVLYLVHQKDLSLCYIITQRCHSGLFIFFFLNRLNFRHLNQSLCCGFSPSGQSIPISVLIILITKVPQVLLRLLCLGVC